MSNEDDADAIAAEFATSWQHPESFYRMLAESSSWNPYAQLMVLLIKQLQQQGYDRVFRAGTQLSSLILSRSRKHGLRADQPTILINRTVTGGLILRFDNGIHPYGEARSVEEVTAEDASLTPEVEALLQRLGNYPVD